MKKILLGLIAFALLLGSGCKKENVSDVKKASVVQPEKQIEKRIPAISPPGFENIPPYNGESIFDYNQDVYPHVTGACYCGKGPRCHMTTGGYWEQLPGGLFQYIPRD